MGLYNDTAIPCAYMLSFEMYLKVLAICELQSVKKDDARHGWNLEGFHSERVQ
jgi:hypothetical protein